MALLSADSLSAPSKKISVPSAASAIEALTLITAKGTANQAKNNVSVRTHTRMMH
jgi:hypothetical protein